MTDYLHHETERFLQTGEYDVLFSNWPGGNVLERATNGTTALTSALIDEIKRRENAVQTQGPTPAAPSHLPEFLRTKLEPMVKGLFPRKERDQILTHLECSIVFLWRESVASAISDAGHLETAWDIANIYLLSVGTEPLGENAPRIVGLSAGSMCYVSMDYSSTNEPFSDFVVHEAAHFFHNTKRRTMGLPEIKRCEWLLPIDFRMRETFAYACEAFGCIVSRAAGPDGRRMLADELRKLPPPPDEQVEPDEYFGIVSEAATRRNGWKAILERCSSSTS